MNIEACKNCEHALHQDIVECRFMLVGRDCGKFLIFPHFCNHPTVYNKFVGHRVVEIPLSIVEQINKRPRGKMRPLEDFTYCIQKDVFKEIPCKINGMRDWFVSWFDKEYMFKECPYYVEHLMGSYHESRNLQKM